MWHYSLVYRRARLSVPHAANFYLECFHSWLLWCCWLGDRTGIWTVKSVATKIRMSLLLGTGLTWSNLTSTILTWSNSGKMGRLNKNRECIVFVLCVCSGSVLGGLLTVAAFFYNHGEVSNVSVLFFTAVFLSEVLIGFIHVTSFSSPDYATKWPLVYWCVVKIIESMMFRRWCKL